MGAPRARPRTAADGNLHVYIEPTGSDWRLRMGTLKGDAAGINAPGLGAIVAALVIFVVLGINGERADAGGRSYRFVARFSFRRRR